MKVKVVGFKAVSFTDQKTGEYKEGTSLKCVFDSPDDTLVGQDIVKIWIPIKLSFNVGFLPAVGDFINLLYEYDGRRNFLVGYERVSE